MHRLTAIGLVLLHALYSFGVQVTVQLFPATCGQCNGAAQALVSGGTPPYSYAWSPNPPNGQGTSEIWGLCPGQWSVLVTDGEGATATADFTVDGLPGLSPSLQAQQLLSDCQGNCTGWATAYEDSFGGTPPYTYSWSPYDDIMGPGSVTFQGLCAGTTPITVVDAQGCTGLIQATVGEGILEMTVAFATPACGGNANGSIYASGPGDNGVFLVSGPDLDSLYVNTGFPPFHLAGVPAGEYMVTSMGWSPWGGEFLSEWCMAPATVTVPSLPEPCGTLNGLIYHDANEDCALNNFDVRLPHRVLSIEPGGLFTISNGNGQFARNLPNGTYTIAQGPLTNEVAFCPPSGSASFTISSATPTAYLEFSTLSTVPHDISVHVTSSAARPGFATQVWVTVNNNSAFPSGDVTVDLIHDPLLVDVDPAFPLNVGVIAPYASITVPFTANLPADVGLLGTVLTYSATASNTATEAVLSNNSAVLEVTITGSYDPNDKRGIAQASGSDDQFFLEADEWIDYTVRFQNTGTDTAFTVILEDTIPAELDLSSLKILGASHPFEPSLDDDRTLIFTFNDIQLPDSATDLLSSQGFVAFRLKPRSNLVPGDLIENSAAIFFDFNPPIITEPSVLVAEFSTGVRPDALHGLCVFPNPADQRITISTNEARITMLTITNTDGRPVLTHAPYGNSPSIDTQALPAGAYFVEATLTNGKVLRGRFIKN